MPPNWKTKAEEWLNTNTMLRHEVGDVDGAWEALVSSLASALADAERKGREAAFEECLAVVKETFECNGETFCDDIDCSIDHPCGKDNLCEPCELREELTDAILAAAGKGGDV